MIGLSSILLTYFSTRNTLATPYSKMNLVISNILILLCVVSIKGNYNFDFPHNDWRGPAEGRERAFDNFVLTQLGAFQSNISGNIEVEDQNYSLLYPTYNATGRYSGINVNDVRLFDAEVGSSLTSMELTLNLMFLPLEATGHYTLNGVVDSLIIVQGEGTFAAEAESVRWNGLATISVDTNGYASIEQLDFLRYRPIVNSSFEGIKGEETIGEFIQGYLKEVGTTIFVSVDSSVSSEFAERFTQYLNSALKTITLEEILSGGTASPTTSTQQPPSTSTSSTGSTDTPSKPDVIVDVNADLAGSGWNVISSSCGYASNIYGFYCNGSPVDISQPYSGLGFWMSPCTGSCTFEYNNADMRKLKTIGITAFYNDGNVLSKISISVINSSGNNYVFELFQGNGTYSEVDLSVINNVAKIDVTMENNGSGRFATLDTLTLVYG